MNKKLKIYILFLLVANSLTAYCKSDFEIAREFMLKKGVMISEKAATRNYDDSYSAFRAIGDNGYVVVENGIVIAYSLEEPLENFSVRPSNRQYSLTPKTPISPMIEAKFNQNNEPYRDSLPLINPYYGTYILSPVGCGALAVAKIMYYYKNEGCEAIDEQDFGEQYPKLEALPETKFDWDNILPKYVEDEYTIEQRIEVAKLMKYVGYAVETEYSAFSSGSWVQPKSLLKLGFSDETYSSVKSEFKVGSHEWWEEYINYTMSDYELENFLDKELEQGRPVMLAGYNKSVTVGHWVVIDGRDDTGRYHIDDIGYLILSQEMFMSEEILSGDILWCLNLIWCVVPIMPPTSPTDISPVKAKSINNGIYNLMGQNIKTPHKGIYIKNGKKYISK